MKRSCLIYIPNSSTVLCYAIYQCLCREFGNTDYKKLSTIPTRIPKHLLPLQPSKRTRLANLWPPSFNSLLRKEKRSRDDIFSHGTCDFRFFFPLSVQPVSSAPSVTPFSRSRVIFHIETTKQRRAEETNLNCSFFSLLFSLTVFVCGAVCRQCLFLPPYHKRDERPRE